MTADGDYVTADPPVRRDGRCARTGCQKKRPIVAAKAAAKAGKPKPLRELQRYAGAQAETDPFCSSRCCRIYHGHPIDDRSDEEEAARVAGSKRGGAKIKDMARRRIAGLEDAA